MTEEMTPTTALEDGEELRASFRADSATYTRDHIRLAALAMALGMGVLWLIDNPHIWTGAVGGLAAVAIRGFYVASDEMKARWDLTNRRLLGPQNRAVRLSEIERLRSLGSAIQIVTSSGDKHLMKYQGDRDATLAKIEAARRGTPE